MEQKIKEALDAIEDVMKMAYNNAYPECCGRPGIECCGSPEPAWLEEDQKIMDALDPVQKILRSLITASPAPEHIVTGLVEALHEIVHSTNRTATEGQFSKYLQKIAANALAKANHEKTARQAALDEAFEAVRKQLCRLPRYSFHAKYGGGIKRTEDEYGNWIEFDAVHALFDPVVVDAALTTHSEQEEAER